MPHQVTITGQTGPARSLTAAVVQNVTEVVFLPDAKLMRVRTTDVSGNIKDFDIAAATVVTVTITAGNFAFVVS